MRKHTPIRGARSCCGQHHYGLDCPNESTAEAICCGMPLKPNEDGLPVAICPKCKTWYRLDTSRSHEGVDT